MPRSFATNAAWNSLAGILIQGGGFLSGVIVARTLGPDDAGLVALILWIASSFVIVTNFGLPAALTRFLPELIGRGMSKEVGALAGSLYRRVALIQAAAALVVLLASLVIASPQSVVQPSGSLRRLAAEPMALLFMSAFCLTLGLHTFMNAYLSGTQAFRSVARLAALSALLQLLCVGIGTSLYGVAGAVLGYAMASVPGAALSLYSARGWRFQSVPEPQRVNVYARNMWLAGLISAVLWTRLELFFLALWREPNAVGQFAVAFSMANAAVQIPMMLSSVLFPHLSARVAAHGLRNLFPTYAAGLRLFAFLVFPVCMGIAALSPVLVPAIFGSPFTPAVTTAMILASGASFAAIASIGSTLLCVAERSHVTLLTDIAGAILFIVAGVTMIPAFGIEGAAWSRVLVQLAVITAQTWYIQSVLECRVPFAALSRLLLAAVMSAVTARLCLHISDGLSAVPVAVAAGAAVYFFAVRLMSALPQGDVEWLLGLSRIVPGPPGRLAEALVTALRA